LNINRMIELVDTLRGEDGCPWDRKQTPRTMAVYLIEEVYELVDAIESGNPEEIRGELGDVLFQIVFIAGLYREKGHFNLQEVADNNTDKMIRRHPHVFGKGTIDDAEEVKRQWHRIKDEENSATEKKSVLDSIPVKLPALMRAYRISERAAGKGFEWDNISGVIEKVEEEWSEFRSELSLAEKADDNRDRVALEFGDILFTLVNVARFARIHPETALTSSIRKFEKRFRHMEQVLLERGKDLDSTPMDALSDLWEAAKRETD